MNFLIFSEFWGGQLRGMASLGVDYVSSNNYYIIITQYEALIFGRYLLVIVGDF
jgi:hypothetical protein